MMDHIRCQHTASASSSQSQSHAGRSTFVSTYFQLDDPQDVRAFLERKHLVCKETDAHFVVKECPFCHATHGRADNLFKLYVHKTKGVYKCHRCGAAGSWFDFKRKLQDGQLQVGSSEAMLHNLPTGHDLLDPREVKVINVLNNEKAMSIQSNLFEDESFSDVLRYLTEQRGLNVSVLRKYGVGALEQPFFDHDTRENTVAKCVSFPWMARPSDLDALGVVRSEMSPPATDQNEFNVIRLKVRAVDDKAKQRLVPKGGSWGLFGWNTVPLTAEEVVLTEGEFDAMAVHQGTGVPAVSLPNGCQSLPPAVLPLLERFKKIYLWLDNDAAGQSSIEKFAAKLGRTRCFIVRMPPPRANEAALKDANDALRAGVDMRRLIACAELLPHSQIASFEHLWRDVFDEICNPLRACGVQSRTLPALNRMLKGHRLGEVTILTGPTGCGKTTLLSQLSLDYCAQGVNTLWGSFEIKNTRLIHKMLTQLAGQKLRGDADEFDAIADKFEALPMYFLRFFGSTDVDAVLDAMEYAVYAYDVQHILLDNVQFMMAGQARGFDKFERQDAALDKFRKFASQQNVHLTLVIHPRKEQEDIDLTLTSVFGSAKATQEADNVLILQRTRGRTRLDIRKNRFDGTLGSIPLQFDIASNCLKEQYEHAMDERETTNHLEVEMRLQQQVERQQHQREQAEARSPVEQPSVASVAEDPARTLVDQEVDADDECVSYFDLVPVHQQQQQEVETTRATTNALDGAMHLNGFAKTAQQATTSPTTPHSTSDAPSGRAPGAGVMATSTTQPGGRPSQPSEPFSAFTPIITR